MGFSFKWIHFVFFRLRAANLKCGRVGDERERETARERERERDRGVRESSTERKKEKIIK